MLLIGHGERGTDGRGTCHEELSAARGQTHQPVRDARVARRGHSKRPHVLHEGFLPRGDADEGSCVTQTHLVAQAQTGRDDLLGVVRCRRRHEAPVRSGSAWQLVLGLQHQRAHEHFQALVNCAHGLLARRLSQLADECGVVHCVGGGGGSCALGSLRLSLH